MAKVKVVKPERIVAYVSDIPFPSEDQGCL